MTVGLNVKTGSMKILIQVYIIFKIVTFVLTIPNTSITEVYIFKKRNVTVYALC
jgi:hypothetical protein